VGLGVTDQGGDVVVREEGICKDLGGREAGAGQLQASDSWSGTHGSESMPSQE
jgi:hypothetical protein